MTSLVIDTHVAVWLFNEPERLSTVARSELKRAMNSGDQAYISAITLVELIYLIEKERLPVEAITRVQNAVSDREVGVSLIPLTEDIANNVRRIPREIVPDMPDRIIAATALALGLPLVTRDRAIRGLDIETIW